MKILFFNVSGRNLLSTLWRRVMIRPSNYNDLLLIVNAWYPELEPLANKLIGLLNFKNFFHALYWISFG